MGAIVIILIATGAHVTWHALLFLFVLLQLYVFCVGIGMFLAQASVFFKDMQFVYQALTTAWLYLTPISYPLEALPDKLFWCIKRLNPQVFLHRVFRDLIYYGRMPGYLIVLAGCGAALLALVLGMWSFMRSKDRFILYI